MIMAFEHVDSSWIENATEDELRAVEDEMMSALNNMDYDSDEYLQLDLKRIDVVNAISSKSSGRYQDENTDGIYLMMMTKK